MSWSELEDGLWQNWDVAKQQHQAALGGRCSGPDAYQPEYPSDRQLGSNVSRFEKKNFRNRRRDESNMWPMYELFWWFYLFQCAQLTSFQFADCSWHSPPFDGQMQDTTHIQRHLFPEDVAIDSLGSKLMTINISVINNKATRGCNGMAYWIVSLVGTRKWLCFSFQLNEKCNGTKADRQQVKEERKVSNRQHPAPFADRWMNGTEKRSNSFRT